MKTMDDYKVFLAAVRKETAIDAHKAETDATVDKILANMPHSKGVARDVYKAAVNNVLAHFHHRKLRVGNAVESLAHMCSLFTQGGRISNEIMLDPKDFAA